MWKPGCSPLPEVGLVVRALKVVGLEPTCDIAVGEINKDVSV